MGKTASKRGKWQITGSKDLFSLFTKLSQLTVDIITLYELR